MKSDEDEDEDDDVSDEMMKEMKRDERAVIKECEREMFRRENEYLL